MNTSALSTDSAGQDRIYAKVTWRLIPLLFLGYVVAYLDRVNVGFAKLQMLSDLKMSDTVYGLGAGIFFIGYFVFEVPSNVILAKTGARVWITRIMLSWGLLSAAMMFVNSAGSFYLVRFLLGLAEAGFFPGIILYLTYWYPMRRRARIVALFMTAIALSGVVGGPLSGWIMKTFANIGGMAGWQWLFVLEGLPSLLVGVWVLFYLDDSIRQASWLSNEEKDFLEREISRDAQQKQDFSVMEALCNLKVWLMALIYFSFVMGLYGVSFWLPQLIKNTGVKDVLNIGLLTAIPYGVAAVVMVAMGRSSDLSGERRWHIAGAGLLGAVGLVFSALFAGDTVIAMIALTVATAGILTTLPLFWALPTSFLTGTGAAAGIALINSVGNVAGFVSPFMVGKVNDVTQSPAIGVYVLAGSMVLGACLVLGGVPKRTGD